MLSGTASAPVLDDAAGAPMMRRNVLLLLKPLSAEPGILRRRKKRMTKLSLSSNGYFSVYIPEFTRQDWKCFGLKEERRGKASCCLSMRLHDACFAKTETGATPVKFVVVSTLVLGIIGKSLPSRHQLPELVCFKLQWMGHLAYVTQNPNRPLRDPGSHAKIAVSNFSYYLSAPTCFRFGRLPLTMRLLLKFSIMAGCSTVSELDSVTWQPTALVAVQHSNHCYATFYLPYCSGANWFAPSRRHR